MDTGVFAARYLLMPAVIGLLCAALVIAVGTWMTSVLRDEYEQAGLGEDRTEDDDGEGERDGAQAPA